MERSERATEDTEPVATEPREDLRVECYVRSNVSAASVRQIEAIVERIQELEEADFVADYDVVQWPPEHRTPAQSDAVEETRGEIVAEFEHWADRNGCSLEPAFRRREVPSSLVGPDEPREDVRVPLVALVLHDGRTDELRGVVPYTDEERTYTVDDWLTAAERASTTGATAAASERIATGGD